MKLVADENIDAAIVEELRARGHTVHYVAELDPSISDDEVLSSAESVSAVLVTSDKDFGELVYRRNLSTAGVFLVRLHGLSAEAKANLVANTIEQHGAQMQGSFSVLDAENFRVRALP